MEIKLLILKCMNSPLTSPDPNIKHYKNRAQFLNRNYSRLMTNVHCQFFSSVACVGNTTRHLEDVCESEDHSALQAVIEMCLRTYEWSEIVLLQDETTSPGTFLVPFQA